jgi:hypothetical protein
MEDSGLGRLIGVLISPDKTFRSIAERPTWVAALVVLVLLGVIVSDLTFRKMDPEEIVRAQSSFSGSDLSQAEVDQRIEVVEKFGRYGQLFKVVLLGPLVLLIIALLFWVALRLLGAELSYEGSLSVTLHSFMPWALALLLSLPVIFSRQMITNAENQEGLLLSNLGVLATEDTSPAFRTVLTSIDLFTLWTIVLLTFGLSHVGRVSKGAAALTAIAIWGIYVFARVGLITLVT